MDIATGYMCQMHKRIDNDGWQMTDTQRTLTLQTISDVFLIQFCEYNSYISVQPAKTLKQQLTSIPTIRHVPVEDAEGLDGRRPRTICCSFCSCDSRDWLLQCRLSTFFRRSPFSCEYASTLEVNKVSGWANSEYLENIYILVKLSHMKIISLYFCYNTVQM